MSLNKEQILTAGDLPVEQVDVPEWGGVVFVRTLTGLERDQFDRDMVENRKRGDCNVRGALCARCITDDKGNRLFDDTDIARLAMKSGAALDRVFRVAVRMNRIGENDVGDAEKN